MSPGRIFDFIAVVCFGLAAIPVTAPINTTALGLVFLTLGHMFP